MNKWSYKNKKCKGCKSTDFKHVQHGYCEKCWIKYRYKRDRKKYKQWFKNYYEKNKDELRKKRREYYLKNKAKNHKN